MYILKGYNCSIRKKNHPSIPSAGAVRSVQLESACSLAALGQGCDTGGTCIAWDNYGSWGSFVEVEVDDWESDSEPDIVCLDDHPVHGLHVPLVPSTTSGSGSVGAPPREESGLELCEVSPKVPTPVVVDAGISDMSPLPEPPVLNDVTNATGPTQDEHGEYKYHVPEQPSFANEVAKMVAEASLPDFSKQGKPRGRKTRTSEAIADEVGDDESDDEKPTKPSRKKQPPKTSAAKAKSRKTTSKAAVKPKAKAKSRSKKTSDVKSPKSRKSKSSKQDDEPSRPKKKQNSRAVRMAATDNRDGPTTPPSGSGASTDMPADARPAPPHITLNNVYSNTYRHALKLNPGDVEGAKELGRKATAFWRQHGMVRSSWTGTLETRKTHETLQLKRAPYFNL